MVDGEDAGGEGGRVVDCEGAGFGEGGLGLEGEGVVEGGDEKLGEGGGVVVGEEGAEALVFEDVGDGAGVGTDDGGFHCHGFDDDEAEGFAFRGNELEFGGAGEGEDVGAEAEEVDVV